VQKNTLGIHQECRQRKDALVYLVIVDVREQGCSGSPPDSVMPTRSIVEVFLVMMNKKKQIIWVLVVNGFQRKRPGGPYLSYWMMNQRVQRSKRKS
jgi:hypothetical protein